MWKAWVIAGLGCLVLVISSLARQRPGPDSSAQRDSDLRSAIARLQQELAAERVQRERAIAAIEARLRLAAQSPSSPLVAGTAAANVAPALPSVPDAGARLPADSSDVTDPEEVMMSAFAAQSDDPGWTRDAEEAIERKLSGQLPASAIESVECRAQLCRLTTIHRSQEAVEGFQLDAFKDPSKRIWDADAFTFVEAKSGDELVVVSYLAREGQSLPNR